VLPDVTIAELKQMIHTNDQTYESELFWQESLLETERTLESYGITYDSGRTTIYEFLQIFIIKQDTQ